MQPRSLMLALALCTFAQFATASASALHAPTASASAPSAGARGQANEGKLIKTAEAQTVQPAAARPARNEPTEERRHGTRTAMLLTAIGVMLAIALRRIGNTGR